VLSHPFGKGTSERGEALRSEKGKAMEPEQGKEAG
jgi:hypothetical protein